MKRRRRRRRRNMRRNRKKRKRRMKRRSRKMNSGAQPAQPAISGLLYSRPTLFFFRFICPCMDIDLVLQKVSSPNLVFL